MGKTVRRACSMAAITVAVWAGPADAQSAYTGVRAPAVGAVDASTGGRAGGGGVLSAASSQQQSLQAAQGNRSGLAFTGTDVASLVAMGGGAIAVGAFLKRRAHA